ncbi:hypothetical protein [Streptomyces sp. NPDC058677]|uniref:hypothetical protein n=1 Tax=Streptomyces sp. NPDC058677 TaxID=3346594 RepID=UPI003668EF8F
MAVLVARCVLAGPGLLRRPVPSAPGRGRAWRRGTSFFVPFGADGRAAAGGPLARTKPSFVGPNGHAWRRDCIRSGPLTRTAGTVRADRH